MSASSCGSRSCVLDDRLEAIDGGGCSKSVAVERAWVEMSLRCRGDVNERADAPGNKDIQSSELVR